MNELVTVIRGQQLPAFIKTGDTRGTENIGAKDVKPPALKLAQAMSPEVKRTEAAYIEGLREGEFFNSITKENYGESPVHFLVIAHLGHRNIEYDPNDRTVVIERNIPDDDSRCDFTEFEDENGKKVRKKPRATRFYDYLVLLLREKTPSSVMTLSLKGAQIKKALQLNTMLKDAALKGLPSFAQVIKGTPIAEKDKVNTWWGWRLDIVGWPTENQYNAASRAYEELVKDEETKNKVKSTLEEEPEAIKDEIPF